jgi:tRNA(Phe) wybutosine-synthesizing methylase Tyw3
MELTSGVWVGVKAQPAHGKGKGSTMLIKQHKIATWEEWQQQHKKNNKS